MSQDIIAKIRENVIQGRTTAEDEGMDESLTGPGVTELVKQAIAEKIDLQTTLKRD
jgi:hypothetical protein